MRLLAYLICLLSVLSATVVSQPTWQADLDSKIRFYQTTDFGLVLAGTERSLYAVDGQTGERLWRRETGRINETAVTPIPDTDLILVTQDLGSKSRLEAVDVITGRSVWQSEKVKGDVMQLAVEPSADRLAVVLVKDTKGDVGSELKRKPIVHVLRLSDGEELWKKELDGSIEMMPSRFGDGLGEIAFTLDNYRAPLMVDGRLFLFYDGATSYDARTGKEKEREKFRINEAGLALTEADPVIDESRIYLSGRGRIRAVNRRTGNVEWKADDLGNAAEMALIGSTLYVRTGGQFTRLKDGELESKGPYGVAAIDVASGEVRWRFKGADKGLTNFVFTDADTILIADRDDLISIDARTGKRKDKLEHKIERAQFVLLNERGDAVVGGRDEIASFAYGREVWRVRHKAPGRGAFRVVAGIALRATALYFRYGGLATSAFGIARGGLNLASAANSFRWSGLRSRFGSFDLTTLASNSARNYVSGRIYTFGSLGRTANLANRASGVQMIRGNIARRITPSGTEVRESVLDRLDPTRYADRLSEYLLRRNRLAELRGSHMYFYTDMKKPFDRKGLVGVNIHTGRDTRYILASDPDPQFVTDETVSLLYSADGEKLQAFDVLAQ
ncbi:MAG: PQQ-binding-like beta-propeller repeat protein [bacterium]|nr:PQQ-binding-like beta-propeller repeat protein [bacterium]